MAASYVDIRGWFQDGAKQGDAYMIVWCDSYDYSDYPGYYFDSASAQKALDNPSSMQRPMEVYDLKDDCQTQMDQRRCWALKPKGH